MSTQITHPCPERKPRECIDHVHIRSTSEDVPIENAQLIGRADNCTLQFSDDLTVSRLHCSVTHNDGTFWLRNFSRHGTWLNGTCVDRAEILAGDRVNIGNQELLFLGRSGQLKIYGYTYSEIITDALRTYPSV